MNNNGSGLRRQAIAAAKNGNWQQAVELNQEIIDQNDSDLAALNRLGMAYLQLKKSRLAKRAFDQVLEIDKTNVIAKKQLARIKSKATVVAPTFSNQSFIEEPGKTKTIELNRLASKDVLEMLSVGQPCELISKNRYISVEAGGQYVGALPEDISFRLTKLMKTGNKYSCLIYTASEASCRVYIKEELRSKRNSQVHSFPPGKLSQANKDLDERYLFDDDDGVDVAERAEDDQEADTDKGDDFIE